MARTVRMFGLQRALETVLLTGRTYGSRKALEAGLVDEVVSSEDELWPAALAWIKANPEASKPWDQPGFTIPGGAPDSPKVAAVLPVMPAVLRKHTAARRPRPSSTCWPRRLRAHRSTSTLRSTSRRAIARGPICSQISHNIIKSSFFDMQRIRKGAGRPEGYPAHQASKVSVIGAGMMGAAIAFVCAKAGIEVVLKDVSQEGAERGKGYAAKVLDKQVSSGRVSEEQRDAILARILPTDDMTRTQGSDLVIEAVFENPDLKRSVFAELEGHVDANAVLGSNTSTLPITDLATGVSH